MLPGSMPLPCPASSSQIASAPSQATPVIARQLAVAAWSASPTDQAGTAISAFLAEQRQDGILPADPDLVNGVAFSPDGTILASADSDGTVRLWNPATDQPVGSPLQTGIQSGSGVNGVAFSPDGKILASADSDGTVRLWNAATGKPVGSPLRDRRRPERRERGDVQPGRQDPGQRRQRRHRAAVEPSRPASPSASPSDLRLRQALPAL